MSNEQTKAYRTYGDPSMRRAYLAALTAADDPRSEFYVQRGGEPTGVPRGGANVRCAFWDGVQDTVEKSRLRAKAKVKGSIVWAFYMAGRDWADQHPDTAERYAGLRSESQRRTMRGIE